MSPARSGIGQGSPALLRGEPPVLADIGDAGGALTGGIGSTPYDPDMAGGTLIAGPADTAIDCPMPFALAVDAMLPAIPVRSQPGHSGPDRGCGHDDTDGKPGRSTRRGVPALVLAGVLGAGLPRYRAGRPRLASC
ncbi:hypothetical protein Acy02nite_82510 [Actinoplanes cyaneus]|uniref:Uncharacterized protein n=1 Tax=Actinoplanes cyaneus TaxID=52696 RepID=A0A919M5F0_9ACTN|nr:hypothetical protein Acy02nite_82510 [Actinoplanes cyaneus]